MLSVASQDADPSRPFSWTTMFMVAAGVAAVGALSLAFSFSLGQALIIWIPAGFALYAVAVSPRSALAGIGLGSFVLAVFAQSQRFAPSSLVAALLPPLAGACSATFRASLGMWLLRRLRAFPYTPSDARSVGLFFLIGVVLLSLIGAVLAISALLVLGFLNWDAAPSVGVVVWSAEALGIMIFTPVFAFAHDAPPGRRLKNATPVIVAGILSLWAVSAVYTLDARAQWDGVSRDVADLSLELAGRVETTFKLGANAVGGIAALFNGDSERRKTDFDAAAKQVVAFDLGIELVEWIPQVPSDGYAGFEATMSRQWGRDYQIFERENGREIRAAERPVYFPISYIYPSQGFEGLLGFDVATIPERKAALINSMEAAGAAITSSVPMLASGKPGVLLVLPVYGPSESRSEDNVRGFAAGVFSISELLAFALKGRAMTDVDYWLLDETDPEIGRAHV